MSSIDQQFIEYIVKSLVGNPDAVKIERRIDEKGVLLELTVDQEDLGRVIGKRGATAQSLRTLLRALGTKNDARYNLKIIDVGGPRPPRDDSTRTSDDNRDDSSDDQPLKPKKSAKGKEEKTDETPAPVALESEGEELEDIDEKLDKKESSSDLAARTRAELADLDDLDV